MLQAGCSRSGFTTWMISDIKLCESVLGGVLRGVEFIYKSPGVNRPLRANEDNPHDNLESHNLPRPDQQSSSGNKGYN